MAGGLVDGWVNRRMDGCTDGWCNNFLTEKKNKKTERLPISVAVAQ